MRQEVYEANQSNAMQNVTYCSLANAIILLQVMATVANSSFLTALGLARDLQQFTL